MCSSLLNTLLPCCFSNPYTSADAYLQPLTTVRPGGGGGGVGGGLVGGGGNLNSSSGGSRPPPSLEELLDASAAAREATWRSLGALEPLALSQHPAGPAAGGPKVRGRWWWYVRVSEREWMMPALLLPLPAFDEAVSGAFAPASMEIKIACFPLTQRGCVSGEGRSGSDEETKPERSFFLLAPFDCAIDLIVASFCRPRGSFFSHLFDPTTPHPPAPLPHSRLRRNEKHHKNCNLQWPAGRCAFRMVRRPNGNILLASDGLSDPFDDLTLGECRAARGRKRRSLSAHARKRLSEGRAKPGNGRLRRRHHRPPFARRSTSSLSSASSLPFSHPTATLHFPPPRSKKIHNYF